MLVLLICNLVVKILNCRINKNIVVRFPKHVCLSEGLLSLRLRIIWFQLKKLNLDWITHTSSIFWLYSIMESNFLWNRIIVSNYLHIQQWFHELILERSLKIVSKKDQTEIHKNFGPIERVLSLDVWRNKTKVTFTWPADFFIFLETEW